MNCMDAHGAAIEYSRLRGGALDPHFATCAECSRFLQAQLALRATFGVIGKEVPDAADLEAPLLAEFDAARFPARGRIGWWMPAAALAACLAVALLVVHRPSAAPPVSAEPFIEIPYIAPLAPYERTSVVRMKVPVSALIAAGFDVHSPDTGAAFTADVLLGQDGRAHAIRLVADSIPNSDRRVN